MKGLSRKQSSTEKFKDRAVKKRLFMSEGWVKGTKGSLRHWEAL